MCKERNGHVAVVFAVAVALCCLAAGGCVGRAGRRVQASSQPRAFPGVEVPAFLEDTLDRLEYSLLHFWDAFTDTSRLCLPDDSLHVSGVGSEALERQVSLFLSLAGRATPAKGQQAMRRLSWRVDAFSRAHPGSWMLPVLEGLLSRYLYDPTSPLRNEDLYRPFADMLSRNPSVGEEDRLRHAREARLCALNPVGAVVSDLSFVELSGRRRRLHGVRAPYVLLLFGDPQCHACGVFEEQFFANPSAVSLLSDGRLKVVDLCADGEISPWRKELLRVHGANSRHAGGRLSSRWICGFDAEGQIRTDCLYNVRAMPTPYLLDGEKRILLKDPTPEKLFAALEQIDKQRD